MDFDNPRRIYVPSVKRLIEGYGPDFPQLEELLSLEPTAIQMIRMNGATPFDGRYYDDVAFLSEVTSQKAVSLVRFQVIKGKFFALSDALTAYDGLFKDKKVVHSLSEADKQAIRELATTVADITRAEVIEKFTEHDTAAAGDYLKILIGTQLPHLEQFIEGIVFGDTSEDTMSLVFGCIANKLVFGHFLTQFVEFLQLLMQYARFVESEDPLTMAGLTHEQAAEPTTWAKRLITNLTAIDVHIQALRKNDKFTPFSGKWSGAIGNSTTHLAAYPDLDWDGFRRRYIEEELGLTYEPMTFQASTYAIEVNHFSALANMMSHVLKILNDFKGVCACPGQQFTKRKKKGTKGSSVMPNKVNLWSIEGAIKMLLKFRALMRFLAEELPDYPHEGNMGRSFLMRDLGSDFRPAFCALGRVKSEMIGNMVDKGCIPNLPNIMAILHTYPGIAGSSLQTVLKRAGIEGDAYRQIEAISINPDGSYADDVQFLVGLEHVIEENRLPDSVAEELRRLVDPQHNCGNATKLAHEGMLHLQERFTAYLAELKPYQKALF